MTGSARWLARGERHLPPGLEWLSPVETAWAGRMRFAKRRDEFLVARWTAKAALAAVAGLPDDEATLRRLEVRHAPSGAPLAHLDGRRLDLAVSLTDRAGWAVCLVGGAAAVGCDLELVEPRSPAFVADYLTDAEARYVRAAPDAHLTANLVWSAKESALKVLGTGLRRDTRSVEVTLARAAAGGWAELVVRTAEGAVFPGWWRRFGEFVLTVAATDPVSPPVALEEPPALAGARPAHTWLARPLAPPGHAPPT